MPVPVPALDARKRVQREPVQDGRWTNDVRVADEAVRVTFSGTGSDSGTFTCGERAETESGNGHAVGALRSGGR